MVPPSSRSRGTTARQVRAESPKDEKTGVASKLRKSSPAAAGKLSRLFDIYFAKTETRKTETLKNDRFKVMSDE